MAAAVLPAVGAAGDVAGKVAGEAIEGFREFLKDDPIIKVSDLLIHLGTIFVIAGGVAYAISKATARQSQAYLNDINSRLGLPTSNSPTPATPPPAPAAPPPPPPPPWYLSDWTAILNAQVGLSSYDAKANSEQTWAGISAMMDLQGQLYSRGSPSTTNVDAENLLAALWKLQTDWGYVPQAEDLYALGQITYWKGEAAALTQAIQTAVQQGEGQTYLNDLAGNLANAQGQVENWTAIDAAYKAQLSGGAVNSDWTGAGTDAAAVLPLVNKLADDLGLPEPYVIQQPASGAAGPASWGDAWNALVTANLSAAAGVLTQGPVGNVVQVIYGGTIAVGKVGLGFDNFVGQAAGTIASGASALVGDVEKAAQMIGLGIINFPMLLWDGLGYVDTWAASTIGADLWPLLLGLGLAMAVGGAVLKFVYTKIWPRLETRVELGANARLARFFNRFDRWFKSRRKVKEIQAQKSEEGMLVSANVTPDYVVPKQELPEPPIPPPPPLQAATTAEVNRTQGETGGESTLPASFAGSPSPPPPPPEEPHSTEETEDHLGTVPNRAPSPEELQRIAEESEKNRVQSMPEVSRAIPEPPEASTAVPEVGQPADKPEPEPEPKPKNVRREPSSDELMALTER